MNELKFNGRIKKIFDVQQGKSSNGNEWKSVDFLVGETSGDYPQSANFRLFGVEKVDNFMKYNKVGDDVEVSFNLKSREYEGRYFNSLDAWKVFKDNAGSGGSKSNDDEENDLPF